MSIFTQLTPSIIKESSRGFSSVSINDTMFAKREINCVGEIDADVTYSLCLQLRYLQQEDPDEQITLFINSPGGEVQSGLAIYDTMKAIG